MPGCRADLLTDLLDSFVAHKREANERGFSVLQEKATRRHVAKLAAWMMAQGYATGHGDTTEDLLEEFEREIGFDKAELWLKRINDAVLAEREACLNCYSPDDTAEDWADKIRART